MWARIISRSGTARRAKSRRVPLNAECAEFFRALVKARMTRRHHAHLMSEKLLEEDAKGIEVQDSLSGFLGVLVSC